MLFSDGGKFPEIKFPALESEKGRKDFSEDCALWSRIQATRAQIEKNYRLVHSKW